jgi:putative tryptophan/tyrosine transport system substrate-binding protein
LTFAIIPLHHPGMDRRRFLLTSLAGALAAPLAAGAQQAARVWRIGVLQVGPNTAALNYTEAVPQGLRDHGYVQGQNIVIEHRTSSAEKENPALVADLVGRKIDVLITWTTPALVAAKKATSTIPIVGISGDPVQMGLVESLARPGGNLTGLAILTDELELKNLQFLKEIVPKVTRVAVLWNPDNPVWAHALKRLKEAAPALGVRLQPLAVRESRDLEAAFAAAIREKAGALLVFREAIFNPLRHDIVNFAAAHRLPAAYGGPYFIEVGGLLVYAANFLDMIRRTGRYVDKILKGAKPADLPIEQATRFELVINLKTAKALGLTIPPALLAQADQVIE